METERDDLNPPQKCPSTLEVCVISQGKSLAIFHHSWELNPGHREDRNEINSSSNSIPHRRKLHVSHGVSHDVSHDITRWHVLRLTQWDYSVHSPWRAREGSLFLLQRWNDMVFCVTVFSVTDQNITVFSVTDRNVTMFSVTALTSSLHSVSLCSSSSRARCQSAVSRWMSDVRFWLADVAWSSCSRSIALTWARDAHLWDSYKQELGEDSTSQNSTDVNTFSCRAFSLLWRSSQDRYSVLIQVAPSPTW